METTSRIEKCENLEAGVLGATPTGRTSSVVRKPVPTVFILPPISDNSATVSVCTENTGNRVVTLVEKATKFSSCSREMCQQGVYFSPSSRGSVEVYKVEYEGVACDAVSLSCRRSLREISQVRILQ